MKCFVKYIVILLIASIFVSCAVNPVTGKRELMLLSEQDEIKMGKEYDPQIVQMYGLYSDEALTNYISEMGTRMGKVSHRPQLTYHFKIMDSPVINAFAVPGGYVYFTRGILAYLNNEAELAGVMGHEIGHITARHSAKQYSKAQLAQIGLGLGSVVSETFSQYAGLAAQGVGILFLKFSRDNEREADDLGVEYSTKSGFDAGEMSNFFVTLNRMHGSGGGSLPDFLSTHPNPDDRVGAIQRYAKKLQTQSGSSDFKVNREKYLDMVDGIPFGEDPRQGYVDDNMFYHPDMKFNFPVSAGWKLSNLPSQVQITSGDEKAAIIFTLGSKSSISAEADAFIADSKALEQSRKEVTVNGLKTVRMESILASQSGNLRILSHFVTKNNDIFVFHGFCPETDYANYVENFKMTLNGFEELRDRSRIDVKPDRIRVKKVNRAMTLKDALQNLKTPDDQLQELSLVNGMELTAQVPAGTSIKIVEKGR